MQTQREPIAAVLLRNADSMPVHLYGNSRYSFHARVPQEGLALEPINDFDRLRFTVGDHPIELGACRFLLQKNSLPQEGRIIFRDEQYDLPELMNKHRLSSSATTFNLPLILAQKDRVTHAFKEYSANLTFELSVYKQYLDEVDHQYLNEPAVVQEQLQKLFLEREGRDFLNFFDMKVQQLREFARSFKREQNEVHGFFFRKQIWDFMLQSKFMVRTNLKPRGYAGDYEMMKMIYDNDYAGSSIFSKLMHKYPLEVGAAEAVRNRRVLIPQMVKQAFADHNKDQPFRVLSVACGPAVELTDFLDSTDAFDRIQLTLTDQDEDALFAARQQIAAIENRTQRKVSVNYLNDSVRTMLRKGNLSHDWGKYDFIYSMGLFDYLTPPVARAVLTKMFRLLRPGGQVVIGNFHKHCKDREFLEYWLDWVLYYRDETEFMELTEELPYAARNLFLEESGSQMFLQVWADKT